MRFKDRAEAGRLLADKLKSYANRQVVVYALPRGGVVLGAEVAQALNAPLDLLVPRKVGHPHNPEYAVCAVTESGVRVCNENETSLLDPEWLEDAVATEQAEAKRRRELYLQGSTLQDDAAGKTAIIVDDGIATGLTMFAAVEEARKLGAARLVVAVPVIPQDTAQQLPAEVDEVVALEIPAVYLGAVGAYYDRFPQLEDPDVIRLLR